MKKDIMISMPSNSYGSYTEDWISDMMYAVTHLGGYFATAEGGEFMAICREEFTEDEANEALRDWQKSMTGQLDDWDPEPLHWNFSVNMYRIVVGKDKKAKEVFYRQLAEADVDWDSMDEFRQVNDLPMWKDWTSKDNHLWIIHIAMMDNDPRFKDVV